MSKGKKKDRNLHIACNFNLFIFVKLFLVIMVDMSPPYSINKIKQNKLAKYKLRAPTISEPK